MYCIQLSFSFDSVICINYFSALQLIFLFLAVYIRLLFLINKCFIFFIAVCLPFICSVENNKIDKKHYL